MVVIGDKEVCGICAQPKKLVGHHLSYDPEIIVMLCGKCHLTLHLLKSLNHSQISKMEEWICQYKSQWENAEQKHYRSKWYAKKKEERIKKKRLLGEFKTEGQRAKEREKSKRWRQKHPEESRARTKKWRDEHLEWSRVNGRASYAVAQVREKCLLTIMILKLILRSKSGRKIRTKINTV